MFSSKNEQDLQEALLQAMEAVSKREASDLDRTLTIEARIVEAVDEGKGIWKVEYKGNTFEASTLINGFEYYENDLVYVLIPNGDFDKNKLILSPIDMSSADYADTAGGDSYIILGDNLFKQIDDVELNTKATDPADRKFSVKGDYSNFKYYFNSSLNDSRDFTLSCKISTNIDLSRRTQGNYGITFSIPVMRMADKDPDVRTQDIYEVTLDIDNINGDPYGLNVNSQQNLRFNFPSDIILDESRLYDQNTNNKQFTAFVEGFPPETDQSNIADITIKDIQVLSTLIVPEEEMQGYNIVLIAQGGNSFIESDTGAADTKKIVPYVYLKGKITNIKSYECYWFIRNAAVDPLHSDYSRFGGPSWQILNEKIPMEQDDKTGKEPFQYNTSVYELTVKETSVYSESEYKCVLVKKDEEIGHKEITIRKINTDIDVKLESDSVDNIYTYGTEKATLTISCYKDSLTNVDVPNGTLTYYWQRYNRMGAYEDNDFYELVTEDGYPNKKVEIDGKTYQQTKIQFDVAKIDISNRIDCTIFISTVQDDGTILKTPMISSYITVTTQKIPTYRIAIANGEKIYKYDADGDSPMVAEYDGALSSRIDGIDPISITLYKPAGEEFTEDEYKLTKVRQKVPVNSMIILKKKEGIVQEGDYYVITGKYNQCNTLEYRISNNFSVSKTDNDIFVEAFFNMKDEDESTAEGQAQGVTNIKFLKDGQSGTNGSKYSAYITIDNRGYEEASENGLLNKLQLIYAKNQNAQYKYNPANPNTLIQIFSNSIANLGVQLYVDGAKVDDETIEQSSEFSIVDSDYQSLLYNDTIVSPVMITDGKLYLVPKEYDNSKVYCAIIQAKTRASRKQGEDESVNVVNSSEYIYSYYPIEITYVEDEKFLNYGEETDPSRLYNVPNITGGFSQVVYAKDGTNPKYDTTNKFFIANSNTFAEEEKICYNYEQNVSENLRFNSTAEEIDINQKDISPTTKYDNSKARNYVQVIYKRNENVLRSEILKYEDLRDKAEIKVRYYENLCNILNLSEGGTHFLRDSFSYSKFIDILKGYQDLLTIKFKVTELLNLMEDILITEKRIFPTNTKVTIPQDLKDQFETLITKIRKLKDIVSSIGQLTDTTEFITQFLAKDDQGNYIQGTNVFEIIGLYDIQCEENKQYTLQDKITAYNLRVKDYENYFTDIISSKIDYSQDQREIGFRNFFTVPLIDFMKSDNWDVLCEEGEEESYRFIPLRDSLRALCNLNQFKNLTSYNLLDEKFLKIIDNLLKDQREFSFYKEYSEQFDKFEEYKAEINKLEGILNNEGIQTSIVFKHTKPIVMLINRYEMSNINGQDGNKLTIDNNYGYILAPQMGAGMKKEGLFTGVIMGVENVTSRKADGSSETGDGTNPAPLNQMKVGLFGIGGGENSFFLNAEDGSAQFGKTGIGQIYIDPSSGKGLIYSGNYYEYNTNGKPNYNAQNPVRIEGSGTLINFTDGYMHFADVKGKIMSGSHTKLTSGNDGFYLSHDGLSIGNNFYIASNGSAIIEEGGSSFGNQQAKTEDCIEVKDDSENGAANIKKCIEFLLKNENYSECSYTKDKDPLYNIKNKYYYTELKKTSDITVNRVYNYLQQQQREDVGSDLPGSVGLRQIKKVVGQVSSNGEGIFLDSISSTIALGSSLGKVYSGEHITLNSKEQGFYLSNEGLSISNTDKENEGRLEFKTQGQPKIYSNSHDNLNSTKDGFYIGSDGLSIGRNFVISSSGQSIINYEDSKIGNQKVKKMYSFSFECFNSARPGEGMEQPIVIEPKLGELIKESNFSKISYTGNPVENSFNELVTVSCADFDDNKLNEVKEIIQTQGISQETKTRCAESINEYKVIGLISLDNSGIFMETQGSTIALGSDGGRIYSGKHCLLHDADKGFYLSNEGLSIGSKVIIDSKGIMKLGLNATKGGDKCQTIDGVDSHAYIAFGGDTAYNPANSDIDEAAKVYIGTDGLSIGKRFSVSSQGILNAYSGEIGGQSISKDTLAHGTTLILNGRNGSMQGGKDATSEDTEQGKQSISSNGKAKFDYLVASKGGKIGGQNISDGYLSNSNITLNGDTGSISGGTEDGHHQSISGTGDANFNWISATGGSVGGWSIGSESLTGGSVTLKKTGDLSGTNQSISNGGLASFSNISITGGEMSGGTITGGSRTGGSISLGSSSQDSSGISMAASTTKVGEKTITTFVGDIVADSITADYIESKLASIDSVRVKRLAITESGIADNTFTIGGQGVSFQFKEVITSVDFENKTTEKITIKYLGY